MEERNIRSLFAEAETNRKALESSWDTNSAEYQEKLSATISKYEDCLRIADQVSLFSPNETADDIASGDIQYLLVNFWIAELLLRITGGDRKSHLLNARTSLESFLKLVDSYDLLSPSDSKLLETYQEGPDVFSTASTRDAAARRETKIARFREEKALKQKLEYLQQNPSALQNDDGTLRELQMTNVTYCVHQTFQLLESIAQELQILAMAPPPPPPGQDQGTADPRLRNGRNVGGYSERLDPAVSSLTSRSGPILSKDGKPLRPFTLLDNRQRLQQGVFRPDHSLPTMTIDEYLEEEKKEVESSTEGANKPNEDDLEKADEETMKARAWDEFKEDNPKGSGNTLNRG
ncbi:Type 2A phosphatase-associated protein 42 [Coniosporium tulheliwenetii]|uniref:Type 2A phosphatase-associated protein 42 n=1 Tax=Coniosporium tulheliwenetii TaxID=3383036 RepID=A0ACC2ZAL3_9PEZI|nr:Type 2A phosphatase-associated protein 42 [Cladosporium sp. JES 115]